ncbi:MAG: hypothetical protein JXQ93_07715 [Flavobacteriaceae bacterium]
MKEEKTGDKSPKKRKKKKEIEQNELVQEHPSEQVTDDTTKTPIEKKHSSEDVRLVFDFQFDSIKETANVLAKGITFYLTIMAGLSWFIFTRKDTPEEIKMQFYAVCLAVWISMCTLIAAGAIAYAIYRGLGSIRRLLEQNNMSLFYEVKLHSFINKGRWVVVGVIICCVLVLPAFYIVTRKLFPEKCFWDFIFWSYC